MKVSTNLMRRCLTALTLFARRLLAPSRPAPAQLTHGWHDLGSGYSVAVISSPDARAYVARVLCYNGLSWALKLRIYWCALRSGRVYIYHRWSLPFYADPA